MVVRLNINELCDVGCRYTVGRIVYYRFARRDKRYITACRVEYLPAIPRTEFYWRGLVTELIDDEFINFTGIPDAALRTSFGQISDLYITGPQVDYACSL